MACLERQTSQGLRWLTHQYETSEVHVYSTEQFRYIFTERLSTGDAKVTFNQAALDISIPTVDNFTKYF